MKAQRELELVDAIEAELRRRSVPIDCVDGHDYCIACALEQLRVALREQDQQRVGVKP